MAHYDPTAAKPSDKKKDIIERIAEMLGYFDVQEFAVSDPKRHDRAADLIQTVNLETAHPQKVSLAYYEKLIAPTLTDDEKAEISARRDRARPEREERPAQTKAATTTDDLLFSDLAEDDQIDLPTVKSPSSVDRAEVAHETRTSLREDKPARADAPKETTLKKRQEIIAYKDADLKKLIYDHLKANRMEERTYSQINTVFQADFRKTDALLGELARDDKNIIKFYRKGVKLYKYAPERKAISEDVSLTNKIVARAIVKFLVANPKSGVRAIRGFARKFFGFLDHETVDRVLNQLVAEGWVTVTRGTKNAKLHSANPDNQAKNEMASPA